MNQKYSGMKIFLISVFLQLFVLNICVKAQQNPVVPDSVINHNFVYTNLDNNSNSANFISKINVLYNINKFAVSFKNFFSSNVTKLSENFYRDYNDFNFRTDYKISNLLSTGLGTQYRTLSDNRDIEINKDRTSFYLADINYTPLNNISVNSKIGLKSEDQIGERNMGISGELNSEISNLNFRDFIGDGKYHLSYDNLTQKTNYNIDLNTTVNKQLTDRALNSSIIRFYDLRSDFYIPATTSIRENYNIVNNIQSRVESNIFVQDNLQYFIYNDLKFQIGGNYSVKNITAEYKYKPTIDNLIFENIYDTKVTENVLQEMSNIEYLKKSVGVKLWFTYSERAEIHKPINTSGIPDQYLHELNNIEIDKNNNSRTTSLILESFYSPVNTHTFRFSTTSSVLRYDTDSPTNFDDRDEINVVSAISHKYNNFNNFDLETIFEFNQSILNYLYKEKSANNNTNRIYKLTTRSNFRPVKRLLTTNLFQVLSNYTVYKYEDLVSEVQSFSFRQLFLADSSNYVISSKFNFDFFGNLKFYEQGEFNDKNFSVRPIAYYDERKYNPQINYTMTDFIQLSAGFRYFIQRQYYYINGVKFLKRTFANYGPLGRLTVLMSNRSRIDFTASQEFTETSDNTLNTSSPSLLINILWNF